MPDLYHSFLYRCLVALGLPLHLHLDQIKNLYHLHRYLPNCLLHHCFHLLWHMLLSLLLRLGLLGIVACLAGPEANGFKEALDAVGRLGTLRKPCLGAINVQFHAFGRVLRLHRVECAELLDETAITRVARVSNYDRIVRAFLCATAG